MRGWRELPHRGHRRRDRHVGLLVGSRAPIAQGDDIFIVLPGHAAESELTRRLADARRSGSS